MNVSYTNDTAGLNLRGLMDLLSDNHSEITNEAARISAFLLDPTKNTITRASMSKYSLAELGEALVEQSLRCLRARDEIDQIRNNLKVS
jgi:hypothetical protein